LNELISKSVMPTDEEDPMEPTEPEDKESNVAIIDVCGSIMYGTGLPRVICNMFGICDLEHVSNDIEVASNDPSITSVIFNFNTPGGYTTGVAETARAISELAKKKKCIAYSSTLCASAGYWLASATDLLVGTESSEWGSVGVWCAYSDITRQLENDGVKINYFYSGQYKLMGAPFKVMTDEEKTLIQKDVDSMAVKFKSTVLEKRSIKDEDLNGLTFSGIDAVTNGYTDTVVNSIKEVVSYLTTKETI
jgi:signal peptide peptidase SppA